APQVGRSLKDQLRLVVIADVERCLGGVFETRIAKGLWSEVVLPTTLAGVVAEQVDVVAIVRLIGRTAQNLQGTHRLARLQGQITPEAPGADLAKHQHLLGSQTCSTIIRLPRQLLNETGQANLWIDPQRMQKRRASIGLSRCRGAKAQ